MRLLTLLGWAGAIGLCAGVAAGCGDTNDSDEGDSESYYIGQASMALGAANNGADCALCHSDDGEQDGYSGSSLKDIAYKDSWKGGGAPTLLDAVNACVTGWMGGEALAEADPAWLALESFLKGISNPEETEPNMLAPEVLADEAAYEMAYADGDAEAGQVAYNLYCAACHDAGLNVGQVPAWDKSALRTRSVGRIAQQVRTAGPPPSGMEDAADSTPGPMPFFEPAELPAQDLANIIAYIKAE